MSSYKKKNSRSPNDLLHSVNVIVLEMYPYQDLSTWKSFNHKLVYTKYETNQQQIAVTRTAKRKPRPGRTSVFTDENSRFSLSTRLTSLVNMNVR